MWTTPIISPSLCRFILHGQSNDFLTRLKKHIIDIVGEEDEFYWDGEFWNRYN